MTSELTTREVSQRLKDLDFQCEHSHVVAVNPNGKVIYSSDPQEIQIMMSVTDEVYPAYSASTLFEWLRAKYHSDPNLALDIQATEITIWLNIGHNPDEEEKEFEYKTSLADMLGESIIWILTQEKENK